MNKSKLRLLADAYARGRISRETYRRERGTLLNGIVAGAMELDHGALSEEAEPDTVTPPQPPQTRGTHGSQRVWLVAGLAAAALLISWLLWPRPETPGVITAGRTLPAQPPAARRQPAAQTLVEDFLAADDWGEASMRRFLTVWRLLPPATREAARVTPWFARLDRELRDELRSQRALAEFEPAEKAREATAPLLEFGRALGLERLPAARPPRTGTPGDARATRPSPRASDPGPSPGLPGPRWVRAVDPARYTLLLYAGNDLVQVERLLHRNRTMDLKVIPDPVHDPRYRVVHGAYPDPEQALQARAELPPPLRDSAAAPIRIGTLLNGAAPWRAPARLPAPLPEAVAANGNEAPETFTLQLFALTGTDNVDRLLTRYPELDLRVLDVGPPAPRYRVYFGEFTTRSDAEAAFYRLPPALIEEARRPVVRERPPLSLADHTLR